MSTRPRREIAAVMGAAVAMLLVVTAMGAAVAVPERSELADTTRASALDYGALEGTVSPLSADYIARTLGRPPARDDAGAAIAPVQVPAATKGVDGPTVPTPAVVAGGPRAAPTGGPATNNTIATAREIEGLPFRETVSADVAHLEPGETGDCLPAGMTWWYRYTTPEDGLVVVSTLSSAVAAVSLAVFEGESAASVSPVSCDRGVNSTRLPLAVRAGQTYWFQLTIPAGIGDVTFSLVGLDAPRGLTTPVGARLSPDLDCPGCDRGRPTYPTTSPRIDWMDMDAAGTTVAVTTRIRWDDRDDDDLPDIYAVDVSSGAATLVSVSHDGRSSGDLNSAGPTISGDGRFIGFSSHASNLVPDDTNDAIDFFVHDLRTGQTERVSVDQDGRQGEVGISRELVQHGTRHVNYGSLSDDGRHVVFNSPLLLHPDDPDRGVEPHPSSATTQPSPFIQNDVYLRDRHTGHLQLLGRDADGQVPHPWFNAWRPEISGDASTVTFYSDAPLTAEDDDEDLQDLYALDLASGALRLVTPTRYGSDDTNPGYDQSLSHDGRWVAFRSNQPGLVADDTNTASDVFRADLRTGEVVRASVRSDGSQAPISESEGPLQDLNPVSVRISDDGRFVAWTGPWSMSPADRPRPEMANSGSSRPWWEHDAYVHDAHTGTTTLLSTDAKGRPAQHGTKLVAMSADGATFVLSSMAHLDGDGSPHPTPEEPAGTIYGPGDALYVRTVPRGV